MPILKKGNIIEYWHDGDKHLAEVVNRAGKATGKYKHRYNVKSKDDDNDNIHSIDL